MESKLAELVHGEYRRMAAHERIADLRHVESPADPLQLLHRARRLDEDAVRAGADVALGTAQGLVQIVHGTSIGPRQDPRLRVEALGHGRPDLGFGELDGYHLLARHMAAP